MKGAGASTILLILAGIVLLMLGFSGRYHGILTAAFPSLAGGPSGPVPNTPGSPIQATASGGTGVGFVAPAPSGQQGATAAPIPGTGVLTYPSTGQPYLTNL